MEVCLVLVVDSSNNLYKYSEREGPVLLLIAHVVVFVDDERATASLTVVLTNQTASRRIS